MLWPSSISQGCAWNMPLVLPAKGYVVRGILFSFSFCAWNIFFLRSSQVSPSFAWKKQISEQCIATLTWPVPNTSGLRAVWVVGHGMAKKDLFTCQGEVMEVGAVHALQQKQIPDRETLEGPLLPSFLPHSICSHPSAHLADTLGECHYPHLLCREPPVCKPGSILQTCEP